jgi:hypothetical protein
VVTVLRIALFAVVGLGGWMIGGLFGAFLGAGLDALLGHDATTISLVWSAGLIAGVLGMVGSVMWLVIRMGRR